MPIIILEGIDGSGKSTLASHLKALSPWQAYIEPRGPMKTTVIQEYVAPLFSVPDDQLMITDRWHLSELIYGPLYRGKSQIDWEILQEIETVLKSLNAIRVVLQPPLDVVTERLATRGEDFLQPEHVPLVYSAYKGFGELLGYRFMEANGQAQAAYLLDQAMLRSKGVPKTRIPRARYSR